MENVKNVKKVKKSQLIITAALLLFGGTAFAYTTEHNLATGYVGLQLGHANTHYTSQWLIQGNSDMTVGDVDNSGFAGRIYGGYNFNKYFALETGFTFLPTVKFNDVRYRSGPNVDLSFRQNILDLCAKGNYPLKSNINYNVDLYGKVGIASVIRSDLEASSGGQTARSDAQDTKVVPEIGVGADYGFTDNVFADLSYMHYFAKDDLKATDFIGFGLTYKF